MIEEVLEEREKTRLADRLGRESTDGTLVDDILKDIKVNLQKIHKHGTRANGIVTSMLLHARGGSGKKEPTDLNALVREYVNLCFHGMRAGKNPINVEIVLDLDTEMGLTSLVKEDFTRVIINLCTNAFDAMRSKTISDQSGNYVPRLRITTKKEAQTMMMVVEDNGPGIPDEIKDKILQPFFTTKKGTEGTGLGLSITHDIVKAHGGSLNVEIKESVGSAFVIQLPIV
ncbi:MAG: HAMP domain-containing histidine kinase [Haliscomenobacter sp.]|nr:HAMP domain-containing histidine kinase [Haliscomenobacter sp.]